MNCIINLRPISVIGLNSDKFKIINQNSLEITESGPYEGSLIAGYTFDNGDTWFSFANKNMLCLMKMT